jgi:hypothetical protein
MKEKVFEHGHSEDVSDHSLHLELGISKRIQRYTQINVVLLIPRNLDVI